MSEKDYRLSERILLILHNLGATSREKAKKSDELAQILQTDVNEVNQIMNKYQSEGYTVSLTDNDGNIRHYLTGNGIIRVCSLFT